MDDADNPWHPFTYEEIREQLQEIARMEDRKYPLIPYDGLVKEKK